MFHTLNSAFTDKQALALRLGVGLIFGLIIAWLGGEHASDVKDGLEPWRGYLTASLAMTAFVLWAGAGAMRMISLLIWWIIAFALVYFVVWNGGRTDGRDYSVFGGEFFLLFPLLFIAHELISSGDLHRRWIAPFETYFDEAWKRGVQLGLAILFTALFWGILWLGAALLGFIGFEWLKDLLGNDYFSWPALGIAFGTAVHLGDVQTKLLGNVRNLVLGVLSWLLPVIAIIGTIFAVSLLASGLEPLWKTKAATATLLGSCVGFVLLINAAYQLGDNERKVPVVLKWCVRTGAVLLLIFAVLAAWSLSLRIGQYGLTPERVMAGLGVVIALVYGVGYALANFVPGRWMRAIEPMNIGFAILKCALFIAIMTPIAAPERLSVNDQVARLTGGKVSVETFDWWLLKDDTGTYGQKALTKLAASTNAAIAAKAKAALDDKIGERPYRGADEEVAQRPAVRRGDVEAIKVVFPAGGKLPESFVTALVANNGFNFDVAACSSRSKTQSQRSCTAATIDLNKDNAPEVLIRSRGSLFVFTQVGSIWLQTDDVLWIGGKEVAFDSGKLRAETPPWQDLMVGDERHRISIRRPLPATAAAAAVEVAPEPTPTPQPANAVSPPSK